MKKALIAAAAGLGLALLVAAAYAVHLVRSLDTPEFKARVLSAAREAIGTEVRAKEMEIHVLSGVTLEKPVIANPAPFPGNLLTADVFVLRYRLWPLLFGRVEVDELRLDKPVLALSSDAQGRFNYEKLGAGQQRSGNQSAGKDTSPGLVPLTVVLRRLAVKGGTLRMTDPRRATLVEAEGADFDSSFSVGPSGAEGRGKARIARVGLADTLHLTSLTAPVAAAADALKLAPIRAQVAAGTATGDVSVRLKGGFRWTSRVELEGANVARLLEEARAEPRLSGTLGAKASFEGGAGLASVTGKGHAEIGDCGVRDVRLLALLAAIFGLPELAHPDFDECRADFVLRGNRLETPALSMKGALVRLGGHGTADLRSTALDYELTLALARTLLDRMPARELRAAFKEQGDGFGSTAFRVTGTFAQPQTDLTSQIGKAAAGELLKGGIGKLFGKKKKPTSP